MPGALLTYPFMEVADPVVLGRFVVNPHVRSPGRYVH
jgi:hypothetical protein